MNIKKLLGKRIQNIRNSKKITQEKLSEEVNIDRKSLSCIETGKAYPEAENLDKIMKALNVTPSEIFTFEHLQPNEILINEMVEEFSKNEDLTKTIYKIFKSLKY